MDLNLTIKLPIGIIFLALLVNHLAKCNVICVDQTNNVQLICPVYCCASAPSSQVVSLPTSATFAAANSSTPVSVNTSLNHMANMTISCCDGGDSFLMNDGEAPARISDYDADSEDSTYEYYDDNDEYTTKISESTTSLPEAMTTSDIRTTPTVKPWPNERFPISDREVNKSSMLRPGELTIILLITIFGRLMWT